MLKDIILSVGVIIAVFVGVFGIVALYIKYSYRPAKADPKGRIMIKPGPVSWFFGVLSIFMLVLIGAGAFFLLQELLVASGRFDLDWGTIIYSFGGVIALYSFWHIIELIFWRRIRASESVVEYRSLKGWNSFAWSEVEGVKIIRGKGHQLKFVSGESFPVWIFGYGVVEMKILFESKEKFFET